MPCVAPSNPSTVLGAVSLSNGSNLARAGVDALAVSVEHQLQAALVLVVVGADHGRIPDGTHGGLLLS
jgi:hypothetical protein